jgi:ATPase subunit of ABC transporter with duplicated ATPase domains
MRPLAALECEVKTIVNVTINDSLQRKTYHEVLKMATKLNELAAELSGVRALLGEGISEVVAKIQELEDALANTSIPDDAQSVLDELKVSAQALADIVPNAPPTE